MWLASFMMSEHAAIVAATFLFPPVFIIVSLVIVLATFGKSLGLRRIYVNTLIAIFEVIAGNFLSCPQWGARQIKTTAKMKRKESGLDFDDSGESSESDEEEEEEIVEPPIPPTAEDVTVRRRRDSGTSESFSLRSCARVECAD